MIATIQKDIEKESNLLKMPREFLVGGKETWKIYMVLSIPLLKLSFWNKTDSCFLSAKLFAKNIW